MRHWLAGLLTATAVLVLASSASAAIFMPNLQHRLAQQNALHGTGTAGGITPPAPPCPENGVLYPPPSQWPSGVPWLFSNCGITELPATGLPIPGNMAYYGGPVQVHPKEYLVYWGWGEAGAFGTQKCTPNTFSEGTITATLKCDPDGAGKYMADFVHDMGGTDWAKVSTQFYETNSGKTDYISNDTNVLGGIWVDDQNDISSLAKTNSSNPAGPSNTYFDLAEEALRAAAHFGVTGAALKDTNFIIVQPPAYSDPNALNAGYCAFHDFTDPNAPGNQYYDGLKSADGSSNPPYIQYSNIPYQIAPALAAGCGQNVEGGNLDGFSIVLGHEIEETITDPGGEYLDPKSGVEYGGWFDTVDADENGDKCAWVGDAFGAGLVSMPGALGEMNAVSGDGRKYPVQSIWSNAEDGGTGYCAGAGTDSPVPAAAYGNSPAADTPASTSAPTISGTAAVGQTLTASAGGWSGSPSAYVYQWEQCDSGGQSCTTIDGATSATYTAATGDEGHTLAVLEYAANSFGSSPTIQSPATSVVSATAPSTPTTSASGSPGASSSPSASGSSSQTAGPGAPGPMEGPGATPRPAPHSQPAPHKTTKPKATHKHKAKRKTKRRRHKPHSKRR